MPDKVVVYLPKEPEPVAATLKREGGFVPIIVDDAASALKEIPDATGLIVGGFTYRTLFPEFEHLNTSLKWIQSVGSGYDTFEKLGVPPNVSFMRAVGIWGQSVAGHAVALTLALMRNLPELMIAQSQSVWVREEIMTRMRSVADRNVVVLGYGDIGQIIAATFIALGADVRIVASHPRTGPAGEDVLGLADLDGLLVDAEAVVMAVPTTPQTHHLINAERLSRMRKDAVIVNVGRGETIDTSALISALSQGAIGGAGLDVFEQEPLPADSELWHCRNLILTPHVANFGDKQSMEKFGALVAGNAKKLKLGETPSGLVSIRAFSENTQNCSSRQK